VWENQASIFGFALLRCMSPQLARTRRVVTSAVAPLSEDQRN
jgi:hypothetical protein